MNTRISTHSTVVNAQWAYRPSDQRFLTVDDLYAKVAARRQSSSEATIAIDCAQVLPIDADDPSSEIQIIDNTGRNFGQLTHYSFGQLCSRAGAPAGFLRRLPSALACANLQWSLETREGTSDESNDVKLMSRTNGHVNIASVTSPTYGRIWDEEVVRAIRDRIDTSIWTVPAASYSKTDPKRATTLYASEKDVFIFLVNENAGIDADGGTIKKGFYVWNSEVGDATFGIACFLYDHVCDNRIIWGMREFREIKIRHTSGGPHRFMARAVPELRSYATAATGMIERTIQAAKAKEVATDREGVTDWLKRRGFTLGQAKKAWEKAEQDSRNYNPRSVWGLVQGLTDSAHEIANTDDRIALETKAGSLLDTVAPD